MTNQNLVRNLGIACSIGAVLISAGSIWEVLQPSIQLNPRMIIDPVHFRIMILIFALRREIFRARLYLSLIYRAEILRRQFDLI
jgi:hypothetical protein